MRTLVRWTVAALLVTTPLTAITLTTTTAGAAEDPTPITVVSSDFENGTTQGWTGRASETVAVTTTAHTGSGALAISGRTASWQGPALDVLDVFEKGTSYTISAWVRMADAADNARLSIERRAGDTAAYDQVVGNTSAPAGSWVHLTGRYTLAHDVDALRLYVETASTTGALAIDDITISYTPALPIQTDIPSVREVVTEFPVGVAITGAEIVTEHGQLLARHFNSVTPGNALKWDVTEPRENEFTFAQADPLIAYAKQNGLAVRGHTFVWHNQTPSWVFTGADGQPMTATTEDKALLLSRLENHIRTVGAEYGDTIGAWDVVNEVIDETQPDGMRRSPWFDVAGLDYLRTAFRVAREVLPNAELFINDYNTNVPAKRDHLFTLVQKLKAEGVPIDGVGHQMHINVSWPSTAETEAMIQKFIPLGVEQQITEMDVSIYTGNGESFPSPPADRLLQQAYKYRDMFALFRKYPAEITSVTLWGLADDNTWLDTFPVTRKDAPLLFDTRLQAKPAYWGVVDPSRIGGTTPPTTPPTTAPTTPPTSAPTTPPAGAGCAVSYRVTGSWAGGFQGDVRVTNTGPAELTGWSLSWQFTGGQRIAQLWNGALAQSGTTATVTNASWNGALAPGGSASFGFLGSWTGSNPAPAAFTLNGTACTAG